jgi:hypothetical protein
VTQFLPTRYSDDYCDVLIKKFSAEFGGLLSLKESIRQQQPPLKRSGFGREGKSTLQNYRHHTNSKTSGRR